MKRLLILPALLASAGLHAQANTQYGQQAGASEQYSAYISVFGYQALYACTYCYYSTALGANALRVSSGGENTAVGYAAMIAATNGYNNTAIGFDSLAGVGSGNYNIGVGSDAGACVTNNGSYNIEIGNCGLAKDTQVIRIGTQGTQKFTQIAGIYNTKLAKGGQAVYVSATGQLGIVNTKNVLPSAQPATQADIATLRQDLVATKNMVYALQRDNALLRQQIGFHGKGANGDPTIRNH